MKNKNIFVACDTSNLKKIKKIINQTNSNKIKNNSKIWSSIFFIQKWKKIFRKI